jgi:tetratricopeptide (TPR) repeat protein
MTSNHLLLYRLAELMLENEQHLLPVDFLFDEEQIGDFVKSIQIDSPYQQLLIEGVLTECVRDEKLFVSFTVEGYFHYLLGEVIYNQTRGKNPIFLKQIVEDNNLNGSKEGVEQCLIRDVQKGVLTRLMWMIDMVKENSDKYFIPLICSFKYIGVDETLKKLLENETENDWELLKMLKEKLDNLNCFNLADELLEKSLPFNKTNTQSSIIFKLKCNSLYPQDAELLLESLIQIRENIENDLFLNNLIGDEYKSWGQYDFAIDFYNKNLEILLNTKSIKEVETTYLIKKIGTTYFLKGDYILALEYYNRSLQNYLKYDDFFTIDLAELYRSFGILFLEKNDSDLSLFYFEKALSIYLVLLGKISPIIQDIYAYIGNCYEEKGELENAINYYENANYISKKILHQRFELIDFSLSSICDCYIKLAEKEERKGNFQKAIDFYKKGIKHLHSIDLDDSKFDLNRLYFKIANFLKNQEEYEESISYLLKCLKIVEEEPNYFFCIAQCYEKINQNTVALYYYIKTIITFESLCFGNIEDWISGIEVFDIETDINPFQKTKELAKELNKENELPEWMNP